MFTSLTQLIKAFVSSRAGRVIYKPLSPNDNSKNQIYLGGNFTSLNILPFSEIYADDTSIAGSKRDRLKAKLSFHWIREDGGTSHAENAALILYPKYPEVRLSGILQGCRDAPSEVIASRDEGRFLLLGITEDGSIIAYAAPADSAIARELSDTDTPAGIGVFHELSIQEEDSYSALLNELKRIHKKGWIDSKRLCSDGSQVPCNAMNCGGYTLEAEFGIRPNGFAAPDYLGWEIKQHAVKDLSKPHSGGPVTLMTPEPTGGFYRDKGVEAFLKEFGYPDKNGKEDRINFGGAYRTGKEVKLTGATLELTGYDSEAGVITDSQAGVIVRSSSGIIMAEWAYAGLITHWNKKHSKAVYVPSNLRKLPSQQYKYGSIVEIAEGTDFSLFLKALNDGVVYYDPAIKMENASTDPEIKKRSQFRIACRFLNELYYEFNQVDLLP